MTHPIVGRYLLRAAALGLLMLPAAATESAAVQLVHLRNGRVLRAEAVSAQGTWCVLTLPGGGSLGVEARLVQSVEEDPAASWDAEAPNLVTGGREVPQAASVTTAVDTTPAEPTAEPAPAAGDPALQSGTTRRGGTARRFGWRAGRPTND